MWLNNVKLVLKDRVVPCAQVRVENGIFTEIIESYGRPSPRFTVIPGLIDLHTDMPKRERSTRAGSAHPAGGSLLDINRRLAAAGITLAYAAVELISDYSAFPVPDFTLNVIENIQRAASDFSTEIRIHGRVGLHDEATLPFIHRLLDRGDLDLITVVDRSSQQDRSPEAPHYQNSVAPHSQRIGMHPFTGGRELLGEIIAAASAYGVPVASHDDDTVEKVDFLADRGVRISEFPVTLEAAAQASARGMHVIMGAPNAYRGHSTRDNLSAQDAARRGVLDILATDYFPPLLLQAAYKLVECGILSLPESIKLVSFNPARAMGLHDRGHIAIGTQADFVVLEEGYLPRVRATYRAGKAVYSDGTAITEVTAQAAAI